MPNPNIRLSIYLTKEQKDLINQEAERLGVSINGFIRLLLNQYFDDIRFERKKVAESQESR